MSGLLQEQAAGLVVVPVPGSVVAPAIGHVVPGLNVLDGAQAPRIDDLLGRERKRGQPEGERHHHLGRVVPECLVQRPDLLEARGDRLLEEERKPPRRDLHRHRRVQRAARAHEGPVQLLTVEHRVGVSVDRRVFELLELFLELRPAGVGDGRD